MTVQPSRGDVWIVDLDPTKGHEQAGRRPCLVVSLDIFNQGPADLVVVLPITTKAKGDSISRGRRSAGRRVDAAEFYQGLTLRSFIKCEDVRSVAKQRLLKPSGVVSSQTLAAVESRLRNLLGL
jgi:mRNA interferase MazF